MSARAELRPDRPGLKRSFSEKMRSAYKDSVKTMQDAQQHEHEDEVEVSSAYDDVGKYVMLSRREKERVGDKYG